MERITAPPHESYCYEKGITSLIFSKNPYLYSPDIWNIQASCGQGNHNPLRFKREFYETLICGDILTGIFGLDRPLPL